MQNQQFYRAELGRRILIYSFLSQNLAATALLFRGGVAQQVKQIWLGRLVGSGRAGAGLVGVGRFLAAKNTFENATHAPAGCISARCVSTRLVRVGGLLAREDAADAADILQHLARFARYKTT